MRIFKRGIIPALVLIVLFSAVCAAVGIASYRDMSAGRAPVGVALVDEDDSVLSRLCISFAQEQSYMKKLLSVVQVEDELQAMDLLKNGDCAAVIVLPENYVEEIMEGTPCRGRIVLSEAAASSAETVDSVVRFGELILAAGQQGVFSGEQLIYAHQLGETLHADYLNEVNRSLISFALEVNDRPFAEETVPYAGTGVSLKAHYAACWLALFLLICGLFFSELYTKDIRRPLLLRLYAAGVSPWQMLCGKLLYPGAFRALAVCAILPLLQRFVLPEYSAFSLFCLFAAIAASTVLISCVAVSMAGKSWQGLILAVAAAGLFLTGGIVPRSMLPAVLIVIGDYSPFGALRALLLPMFGGKLPPGKAAAAVVYSAAVFLLCLHRLRRPTEKGGAL